MARHYFTIYLLFERTAHDESVCCLKVVKELLRDCKFDFMRPFGTALIVDPSTHDTIREKNAGKSMEKKTHDDTVRYHQFW